jgi:hypothetical protein
MIAALDGPVTWQVGASVLALLLVGAVVLAVLSEIANPDREDDR